MYNFTLARHEPPTAYAGCIPSQVILPPMTESMYDNMYSTYVCTVLPMCAHYGYCMSKSKVKHASERGALQNQ